MLTSWGFWMTIVLLTFFIMWLIYGGQEHKFIGLAPLHPDYSVKDIDDDIPDVNTDLEEIKAILDDENKMSEVQTRFDQKQGHRQRSRGESICKQCLEYWFRVPFISVRPDWLKSPYSKSNLELDCYNADFHLAAEYNGIQHYVFPNRYMKKDDDGEAEFRLQVSKDEYKFKTCNKKGVHLIVIPYTVKEKDIPDYLRQRLPPHLRQLAIEDPKIDID